MDNSIKNLEMDLQNAARSSTDPDDMFAESMGQFSKGKHVVLNERNRIRFLFPIATRLNYSSENLIYIYIIIKIKVCVFELKVQGQKLSIRM